MDIRVIKRVSKFSVKASNKVAKYLLSNQNKATKLKYKDDNDLLTNADLESDKIISEILVKKFPEYNLFSEESSRDQNSKYSFYIDPLDGTVNYLSQLPLFGISISFLENDTTLFGLINIPFFNQVFYSDIYKKHFEYKVSKKSVLNEAIISIILTNHFKNSTKEFVGNIIKKLSKECLGVRVIVSLTYELSLLIKGNIDAVVIPEADYYGVKSGEFLVEKSEGITTNLSGDKFIERGDFIVASNKYLHSTILDSIKGI